MKVVVCFDVDYILYRLLIKYFYFKNNVKYKVDMILKY